MPSIRKATENDAQILSEIGPKAFMEAHSQSAPLAILTNYLNQKYALAALREELLDPANHYYLILHKNEVVGFSKINFDTPCTEVEGKHITKLDRLYLLQSHHGLGLGYQLFEFNVNLAKKNNQTGMWLFTWTENHHAIAFYKKLNFKIVGSYLFRLDETRANPNHVMYVEF